METFLKNNLPFWNKLTQDQKDGIISHAYKKHFEAGNIIHSPREEFSKCLGLVIIEKGRLRAYMDSPDGKQLTIMRLLDMDSCIITAGCMINSFNFDISVVCEKPSDTYIIPTACFKKLNDENIHAKNYSLEMVSACFSEAMWIFEQFVFGSSAKRLASFLLMQYRLEFSETIYVTHEFIANDIGTAREVVTRLLKHFAKDNLVSLGRGSIKLNNIKAIEQLTK